MKKPPAKQSRAPDPEVLEVRASGVHGLGLFARSPLRSGQILSHYEGRRLSAHEALTSRDDGLTYLFALSDGSFIDGDAGGNVTRHLNHSCAPNCYAEEFWHRNGELGVRIKTLRAIATGEELFLDYSLIIDPTEEPAAYPCNCSAEGCRKSLAQVMDVHGA
ncbi:MAG: SET domain-containing protein [Rubrivivax sp.]|nr:MAG: SET domain-containing protein [Rubrivivax sp.]